MKPRHPFADTCEQILREQLPNLLRLYVNPYVVQTCYCLGQYVATTWPLGDGAPPGDFQTFLANGFDEALGGAIKLARYDASLAGRPATGLVIDPSGRLGPFCSTTVNGETLDFIPGVVVTSGGGELQMIAESSPRFGFVVLVVAGSAGFAPRTVPANFAGAVRSADPAEIAPAEQQSSVHAGGSALRTKTHESAETCHDSGTVTGADDHSRLDSESGAALEFSASEIAAIRQIVDRDSPRVIVCVDRFRLAGIRNSPAGGLGDITPDIVVFDESFVNGDVPFSAFTAAKSLYDHWNRPGKTTFHSTTYQPNTISTLHFMRCLPGGDPEFHASVAADLGRIIADFEFRGSLFKRLYSKSLYGATRAAGCDTADVRAAGDFVIVNGRNIFDGVSGVACSVRGHNPAGYADEMDAMGDGAECAAEIKSRLHALTGLENILPAVSGATAVENALKLALVAQHPRRHVLALKSGFGGKTLLSLTGTWNSSYKQHIEPLYADVSYIDPFADDALAQIDAALARQPVAVVQAELVQGVGGVRRVPEVVIRYLAQGRARHGYLLLIDEVQTGAYRTGPFTMSRAMGLVPDLLAVGKGVSDMMFPFALLMYSTAVAEKLDRAGSDLIHAIHTRYDYAFGYRTVLNMLRRADELRLPARVAEAGALVEKLLKEGLAGCKGVREVRVYGMLIGIELDAARLPRRWFRKKLFWFFLFSMLRHPKYPVLVGFCQYEPNVLKITPSLMANPADLRAACATIIEVLQRPFPRLLAAVAGGLVKSHPLVRSRKHDHAVVPTHEPAPC